MTISTFNEIVKENKVNEEYIYNEQIKCSEDFWYWYSTYVYSWDVNDRENGKKKAPTWKYLKKFLKAIKNNRRIFVLKSRQQFVSTFACLYVLWLLLYSDRAMSIFIISETRKKAYNGTKTSLYGRIFYAYDNLPDWMKTTIIPKTFPEITLTSEVTGVNITFSACTDSAGRGDSYDLVIVDEYAWMEGFIAKDLISGLLPNSYALWAISTPRGKNHFWKLMKDIENKNIEGFIIHKIHYTDLTEEEDNKRYNIYRETVVKGLQRNFIGRELDFDFEESQEGRCFPDFILNDTILFNRPTKENILQNRKVGGMDFGIGEPSSLSLYYINPEDNKYHSFLCYEKNNCLPSAFLGSVRDELKRLYEMNENEIDNIIRNSEIFGDSSGKNRSQTEDTNLIKEYHDLGMKGLTPSKKTSNKDGIYAIHQLLEKKMIMEYYDVENSEDCITKHIRDCHYHIGRTGVITSVDEYDHDSISFSSHKMDCLKYLAINETRIGVIQGLTIDEKYLLNKNVVKSSLLQNRFISKFGGRIIGTDGKIIGKSDIDKTNLS
jgi:hypothetical protein